MTTMCRAKMLVPGRQYRWGPNWLTAVSVVPSGERVLITHPDGTKRVFFPEAKLEYREVPGPLFDPERFVLRVLRQADAEDVVLFCLDCKRGIYGDEGDGIGKGEPDDNTLDRLTFIAMDHATLYCNPEETS